MNTNMSDPVFTRAIASAVRRRHDAGAFGVIVSGIPQVPLWEVLGLLGGPENVYISIVGADDAEALVSEARRRGWPEENFGLKATHATAVRNRAPEDALKLVVVWREEDRLHSLTRRGYEIIGPAEIIHEICAQGVERSENQPWRAMWRALASPQLGPFLSADAVLRFFTRVFRDDSDTDSPRTALPLLGLLVDPQLLTERFLTEEAIVRRLVANAEMVDRIQRADEEDRQKAAQTIHRASPQERQQLDNAYSAFLRIARSDLSFLSKLSLDEAIRLLSGKKTAAKNSTPPDEDEGKGEDESRADSAGDRWRTFPTLAAAAIQLAGRGEFDLLEQLVDQADEKLKHDGHHSGSLSVDDVRVQFVTNEYALALCRTLVGKDRFGGTLRAPEHPVEVLLNDIGRYIDQFELYDEVRFRTLGDYMTRARGLASTFEGAQLLDEYVNRREQLLPFLDLLVASPLACLVANQEARAAAQEAIRAYERLLSHMDETFALLRRKSVEGTTILYNEVLSMDLVRIHGEDELAALLTPLNPLVLWKYTELAALVLERGTELSEADLELLTEEIADLPEPLLAVHAPGDSGRNATEVGYAGRIGSMPLYQPVSLEEADLSERSLRIAGEKLLALYPPARENLRLLLVDPVSTRGASKALRTLFEKHGIRNSTILIARMKRRAHRGAGSDSVLDEISTENRVTIEEMSISSMEALQAQLARQPVHILGISGLKQKNVQLIESEGTRLHPLSLPHRLHADPLLNTVALRPRSVQPADEAARHPFGLYHSIVAQLSGNPYSEFSVGGSPQFSLSDFRPVFPHCQLLIATGDLPHDQIDPGLLRLTQGIDLSGDAVFTQHRERIVRGMNAVLRRMNYQPSPEGLEQLLDRIQEIGGEGIFAAVSDKSVSGFSESALRGQLGLAVALTWYRTNSEGEQHLLLSLDSHLARKWLKRRDEAERNDLLGFRLLQDGSVIADLIEVKSYQATDGTDVAESHPGKQLRSVAKVLHEMFYQQGDILIDRRRELLRLQVYREGLLPQMGNIDAAWVTALNEAIDGPGRASIRLTLLELSFGQNFSAEEEFFDGDGEHPASQLEIRRLRLGEQDIRRYLEGVLEQTAAEPCEDVASENEAVETADSSIARPVADVGMETSRPTISDVAQGLEAASAVPIDPVVDGPVLGFEPFEAEWQEIEQTAKSIYRVLKDFGVGLQSEVDPNLADVGPSIVRYKVRLKVGERVSTLQNRARDLMRELAAEKEPIIDNLPNTQFVYIDLPRPERQPALFRPLIENPSVRPEGSGLYCPVGVTPDGRVEWLDLTELPHMLVAGSTGSGKTMFLYSLIVGLVRLYDVGEVELLLVDPKETDFVFFGRILNLRGGHVICDPREAVGALNHLLVNELEHRTAVLKEAYARDVKSYNQRYPDKKIAPIVVVIDEFADLSDVMEKAEREQFDQNLRRLAQRARNVGIHLILATQRPTADIVNGTLKSNLPCRVSFRLASNVDSRTILDRSGAEHLLGNGDMLLSWNGKVLRLQGFYLPERDIIDLLDLATT